MKGWTPKGAVPVVIALAALAAGCQSSEPAVEADASAAAATTTTAPAATITASDQPAGAGVTVASVTMPAAGFVTIHASDADGNMAVPDSIGHIAVPAGTSENVVVPLDTPGTAGQVVHLMLHEDTGQAGVYEFKTGSTEVDLPVIVDGAPVVQMVTLQ